MFRIIISLVIIVLCFTSAFAGNWERVTTVADTNGNIVMVEFEIENGPATDCDRIIIADEAKTFLHGYSVEKVRAFRRSLKDRGIPMVISRIAIGNIFDPMATISYNTFGL